MQTPTVRLVQGQAHFHHSTALSRSRAKHEYGARHDVAVGLAWTSIILSRYISLRRGTAWLSLHRMTAFDLISIPKSDPPSRIRQETLAADPRMHVIMSSYDRPHLLAIPCPRARAWA